MGFGDIIKQARLDAGLSQEQLGKLVGVSGVAVGQWEKGSTLPRGGHAQQVIKALHIDPRVLLSSDPVIAMEAGMTHLPRPTTATAPLYATICAGTPIEAIEAEGRVPIPEPILEKHPHGFFLKVSGDSMNRVLPDGSYALVDPDADVANGDVAVVIVNGCDATIKRVYRLTSSVVLQPDSIEEKYTDTIFDYAAEEPPQEIKVIGRVVWYVAPYGERL